MWGATARFCGCPCCAFWGLLARRSRSLRAALLYADLFDCNHGRGKRFPGLSLTHSAPRGVMLPGGALAPFRPSPPTRRHPTPPLFSPPGREGARAPRARGAPRRGGGWPHQDRRLQRRHRAAPGAEAVPAGGRGGGFRVSGFGIQDLQTIPSASAAHGARPEADPLMRTGGAPPLPCGRGPGPGWRGRAGWGPVWRRRRGRLTRGARAGLDREATPAQSRRRCGRAGQLSETVAAAVRPPTTKMPQNDGRGRRPHAA